MKSVRRGIMKYDASICDTIHKLHDRFPKHSRKHTPNRLTICTTAQLGNTCHHRIPQHNTYLFFSLCSPLHRHRHISSQAPQSFLPLRLRCIIAATKSVKKKKEDKKNYHTSQNIHVAPKKKKKKCPHPAPLSLSRSAYTSQHRKRKLDLLFREPHINR